MENGFCSQLNKLLLAEGITLPEEKLTLLFRHWQLLSAANRAINLTAITAEKEALEKHYLDSLLLLPYLREEGALLDIGSGAGFPGLPLAVAWPERPVTLLEATEKRARFLLEAAEALGLANVAILNARAENAARKEQYRESFAIVTARAVAALPVLLEYALPFLQRGGLLLAMKGPALPEELAKAKNALALLGGEVESVVRYKLPISGDGRTVAVIRKNKATPEKYPRREGKPEKAPL